MLLLVFTRFLLVFWVVTSLVLNKNAALNSIHLKFICGFVGNQTLLQCSFLWKKLLNHYHGKWCVVNPAKNIQVQKNKGGTQTKGVRTLLLKN